MEFGGWAVPPSPPTSLQPESTSTGTGDRHVRWQVPDVEEVPASM